jgi:hypothetical protein
MYIYLTDLELNNTTGLLTEIHTYTYIYIYRHTHTQDHIYATQGTYNLQPK